MPSKPSLHHLLKEPTRAQTSMTWDILSAISLRSHRKWRTDDDLRVDTNSLTLSAVLGFHALTLLGGRSRISTLLGFFLTPASRLTLTTLRFLLRLLIALSSLLLRFRGLPISLQQEPESAPSIHLILILYPLHNALQQNHPGPTNRATINPTT